MDEELNNGLLLCADEVVLGPAEVLKLDAELIPNSDTLWAVWRLDVAWKAELEAAGDVTPVSYGLK